MTRNRDIERVLDRFYAEGPSEVPDRLLLGVIDRIERVPQRRLAHQMTRFATMNSQLRLAAAAAIVVALVGVGAFALSRIQNVAAPATPSPSIPASPSQATGASAILPVALQNRWVGAPRVVPGAPEPPYRLGLQIAGSDLGFRLLGGDTQTSFSSSASLLAADQLALRLFITEGGCQSGDQGTYSFSLAAEGTALTITPISDACASRSAALAGDWVRASCPDQQAWCLGDMPPGTYSSTRFIPFEQPETVPYDYGQLSYTVPAGWSNFVDCTICYGLARDGAPVNDGVYLWSDIVPHSQDESCPNASEPGVGRTAAEITEWLVSLPGLVATTPVPVTVGGLAGSMLDLSVAADWTHTCSYSEGKSMVSTFVDSDDATEGFDWNIGEGSKSRYFLLDLGDGRALLVEISAGNVTDFDDMVAEAMPVIDSFTFRQ